MTKGKKIIVGIFIFMLLVGIGAYGTYEFYVKPKYLTPMVSELENFLADEDNLSSVTKALEDQLKNIEVPEDISLEPSESTKNAKDTEDSEKQEIAQDQTSEDKSKGEKDLEQYTKENSDSTTDIPTDSKVEQNENRAKEENAAKQSKIIESAKPTEPTKPAESQNNDSEAVEETNISNETEQKVDPEPVKVQPTGDNTTDSEPTQPPEELSEETQSGTSEPETSTGPTQEKDSISVSDSIPIKSVGGKDVKELEKKVDTKDKIDGIKLLSKLDISYLMGLAKNGVTGEEKKLVKEHMQKRLTDEEYEKAKELIYKYIGLLK